MQHWKEGGHDKLCKQIKRSGGAEQYNATIKYTEAVAVAAEKCADDTKGQTCYICTQALHWKTKEGLVRMCACRGRAGVAHVSCLAEQAKILFAEAEEDNLGDKAWNERWIRWDRCGLCEQKYHGVVSCALGWACWKTYLGRSEGDQIRILAMGVLGSGLFLADYNEAALSVKEAQLAMMRRFGASLHNSLITQGNLASTYERVGRLEEAGSLRRDVYSGWLKLEGEEYGETLREANNYASSLNMLKRFEEAKSLLRKMMPVARRVLGEGGQITLMMRRLYASALCADTGATVDDLREAVTTLEELARTARRVFGRAHPDVVWIECDLGVARTTLRAREGDGVSLRRLCEAEDATNLREES